ncbi:MAG: polysaccharide deacetylase family protein [Candidatus Bathyarchaeota archaeon]
MKIIFIGAISTAMILVIGFALVIPFYFQFDVSSQNVMLVFSVIDSETAQDWFNNLTTVLRVSGVPATIFITGDFANSHPGCLDGLADSIDVGSQTYSYMNLTDVSDYLVQLQEVKRGKEAVDAAGKLDSRLFKAPFGNTDNNIYSLLNRSGIIADFSYADHYNKFYNGQFIRIGIDSYDGSSYSADFFLHLKASEPIMINFNTSTSVKKINELINALKASKTRFATASEVTGLPLTVRYSAR